MRKGIPVIILLLIATLLLIVIPLRCYSGPFAYIANSNDDTVTVIDTATNTVVGVPIPVGSAPASVAVNPEGTRVFVSNEDSDTVSVIDTNTNTVISTIPVGNNPCMIAFADPGTGVKAYVANCLGGSVSVIDTATNSVIKTISPVAQNAYGAVAHPSGYQIYVTDANLGFISKISTVTDIVSYKPPWGFGSPKGLDINPAGTRLYVTDSNAINVVDAATLSWNLIAEIPVGADPRCVALSPDGTRAYVTNSGFSDNGNTVSVIDTGTNTVTATITVGTSPEGVSVDYTGSYVYVANKGSDTVSVIDAGTNTVIHTIPVGDGPVSACHFIQPVGLPVVSTAAVTGIANITATGGGTVTHNGGVSVTARGVCWNTDPYPTMADSCTSNGSGIGAFTSSITGLTPNTPYHVRAYAVNSEGTAYGNDVTFTTASGSVAPTVTTAEVTGITQTTASGGGNVTSLGGASVTARGVCWGTSVNPTISGSHTTDGTGAGPFTSAITGLTLYTPYHVRAYAVNSVGTAYGGDLTFTTNLCAMDVTRGGTSYATIQESIGGSGTEIRAVTRVFQENLSFTNSGDLTLSGGYACGFGSVSGFTTLSGNMTINSGSVTVENLVIK
jgi:YVTN family beta-propeller protein